MRRSAVVRAGLSALVAVCMLLPASPGCAGEESGWITQRTEALRRAVDSKAPADERWRNLTEVLLEVCESLRLKRAKVREANLLLPLIDELDRVPTGAPRSVRVALWRAAASSCHPRGLALLSKAVREEQGARAEVLSDVASAVSTSHCGRAHAWVLLEMPGMWRSLEEQPEKDAGAARKAMIAAARAAIATLGPEGGVSDGKAGVRAVGKALPGLVKKAAPDLHHVVLVALAETPAPVTRKVLKKWMSSKNPREETLVAVLEGFGRAGDPETVPLFLTQLQGSTPPVLEATLVGLFALPEETLKAAAKSLLGTLFKVFDDEGREGGSLHNNAKRNRKQDARLAALQARSASWHTRKILDTPPMELPSGATGVPGVNALIWRILDTQPKGIRPPEPPKDARPRYMNGRPNLVGRQWALWWKNAR